MDKFYLSSIEQTKLLTISRTTLTEFVTNKIKPKFDINEPNLLVKTGVFVTLNKQASLRGCIGYIEGIEPLYQAVINNTISACCYDPRFPSVQEQELKDIHIEISVLTPPKQIQNWEQIKIGKHGIIFRNGLYQSVFLPQVATEQNWDLQTTLSHLSLKAGLSADAWLDKNSQFKVFEAQIFGE